METSKNNKQIIFKTLSATPLIAKLVNNLPSTTTETSSSERTLSRYSGMAHFQQELGNIQSAQSLLNMPQQGNLQEIANTPPNVFGFRQAPNIQRVTGTSLGSNLLTGSPNMPPAQSISSMQFLKPGMGSTPQREQEAYENGGKTIHVQAANGNVGFTPWSEWTPCSASCGRGIRTRTRSCISAFSGVGIDRSCFGPKVQTKRCRKKRCPGRPV